MSSSWINLHSLSQALQTQIPHLSSNNILSYESKEKKSDGNHYSSHITTIKVSFKATTADQPKRINLFTKTVIDSAFGQMLAKTGILAKEKLMYSSILPEINALLKDDSVSPISYGTPKEGTIILEDLSEEGYVLINRIEQLDYLKTIKVLTKLAKLHAASVAVHKKIPSLVEEAGTDIGLSEKYRNEFITFLENALETVADRLDTWTEIKDHKRYAASIRNVKRTLWTCLKEAREHHPHELRVLNHNDLWLSNIMFKFNSDSTIQDVKFVDFQLCTLASPVIDLHQFLTANVQFQVFVNQLDELLAEYLKVLNKYLEKFETGFSLTNEQLKSAYEKKQILGFYAGIVTLIPVLADPQRPSDFSESSSKEMAEVSLFDRLVDSKYYREALPKYLKYFEERGILVLERE